MCFFRVLNDAFHRGRKSALMHVVAQGGGGKQRQFCRRKAVKPGSAHTHNMQESQDRAVDSVGLMSQVTGSAAFLLLWKREPPSCDYQDYSISIVFLHVG